MSKKKRAEGDKKQSLETIASSLVKSTSQLEEGTLEDVYGVFSAFQNGVLGRVPSDYVANATILFPEEQGGFDALVLNKKSFYDHVWHRIDEIHQGAIDGCTLPTNELWDIIFSGNSMPINLRELDLQDLPGNPDLRYFSLFGGLTEPRKRLLSFYLGPNEQQWECANLDDTQLNRSEGGTGMHIFFPDKKYWASITRNGPALGFSYLDLSAGAYQRGITVFSTTASWISNLYGKPLKA